MAKQSLGKRIDRIVYDAEGKGADPRKRWAAVVADGIADEAVAALGPMPEATLDDIPLDEAVYYAGRDADATLRETPALDARIKAMGLEQVLAMDVAIIPMVEHMQSNGILIDRIHLAKLSVDYTRRMSQLNSRICRMCKLDSFNPNSGDQVAYLLFGKLGLDSRGRMTKGRTREATDDKALEPLRSAHPVVPLISDYRELSTLKNNFCDKILRMVSPDGRIRGTFRLTRIVSGRISVSEPPLTAIPVRTELGREIRRAFIAPKGCVLGDWDLDQIEMRVMAHESQDKRLVELYRRGADVHSETARLMYGKKDVTDTERYPAKRINFSIITGITAQGLADQMAVFGAAGWTVDRCQEALDDHRRIYPGVWRFLETAREEARRTGMVRDMWGRLRYLPGVHSNIPKIRAEAERQAHSHKISAGAQGILKRAMSVIWEYLEDEWRGGQHIEPLLQVHDELLFECRDDGRRLPVWGQDIADMMEQTTELRVPVKASYKFAPDWAACKEDKISAG